MEDEDDKDSTWDDKDSEYAGPSHHGAPRRPSLLAASYHKSASWGSKGQQYYQGVEEGDGEGDEEGDQGDEDTTPLVLPVSRIGAASVSRTGVAPLFQSSTQQAGVSRSGCVEMRRSTDL